MHRLIISAVWVAVGTVVAGPAWSDGAAQAAPGADLSGYLGCRDGERAPAERPANSGGTAGTPAKGTGGYEFARPGEPATPTKNDATPCYQRVDGVWQADTPVGLDLSVDLTGWGGGDPSMLSLAHGTYTKPTLLLVKPDAEGRTLTVYDAHDLSRAQTYQAEGDGRAGEALSERSQYVRYQSTEAEPFGASLELGTTFTGRSELRIGSTKFVRPAAAPNPHQCLSATATQSADDPWMTTLKFENLRAVRRGYDVATQDPFYILQNPKADVFMAGGQTDYCVVDRSIVPTGWTLVNEGGAQGYTFRKSLATSAREHQTINASSFGLSVEASKTNPKTGEVIASASYGAQEADETVNTMRKSSTVAQGIGFSRQKLNALVVNEGFAALSDRFIDLVQRIRLRPDDALALDELIDTFGTHYAYAVTFGANAKLTQSFSQVAFDRASQESESFERSGGASLFGVGGSANSGSLSGTTSGRSGSYGTEGATFVAVGGNGSWNEQGYSAGNAPYPILLDVRSLDTLLSPIYFADYPEIYGPVRQKVRDHIALYLAGFARRIDNTSLVRRIGTGTYAIRYADIPGMEKVSGHLALQVYEVRPDGLTGYLHQWRDGGYSGEGVRLRPHGGGAFGYEGNHRSVGMALELKPDGEGIVARLFKLGTVRLPYCGEVRKLENYKFPDC